MHCELQACMNHGNMLIHISYTLVLCAGGYVQLQLDKVHALKHKTICAKFVLPQIALNFSAFAFRGIMIIQNVYQTLYGLVTLPILFICPR